MHFYDDDFVGGAMDRRRRPRVVVCRCREVGVGGVEDNRPDHDDYCCKCKRCRRPRRRAVEDINDDCYDW